MLVLMVLMVLMLLVLAYHIFGDENPEIFVGQLALVVLLLVVAAQLPQVPHAQQ